MDGAISPRKTPWKAWKGFSGFSSLLWFRNVAICSECNQLRSFHEVYFKSRYVLHHLCRWVSHHLLTIKHVFVPPNFVAKETTLFPHFINVSLQDLFPLQQQGHFDYGRFQGMLWKRRFPTGRTLPFSGPSAPSGAQKWPAMYFDPRRRAVCSLKTGVAWCTQEKTKETPFLGTEEDMKSPWWQIAGNIHHMTQWRNTFIRISQGIFQEWVYRFKGFMFHAFHAFLKVSFEMIV